MEKFLLILTMAISACSLMICYGLASKKMKEDEEEETKQRYKAAAKSRSFSLQKERQDEIDCGRIENRCALFIENDFSKFIGTLDAFKKQHPDIVSIERGVSVSKNMIRLKTEKTNRYEKPEYEEMTSTNFYALVDFWYRLTDKEWQAKIDKNSTEVAEEIKRERLSKVD